MKIENMTGWNGNRVVNQFIITDDDGNRHYQSKDTVIAVKVGYSVLLDHKWDYDDTRFLNEFLNETTKETEAKIKSGEYTLTNLNE